MLSLIISDLCYVLFDLAQLHCKTLVSTKIKDEKILKEVKISLADYKSYNDHDEIRIEGLLYDIAKIQFSGDSVKLSVYHDQEEELWVDGIVAVFDGADKQITNINLNHISKFHCISFNDGKILTFGYPIINRHLPKNCCEKFRDQLVFFPEGHYAIFKSPPERSIS